MKNNNSKMLVGILLIIIGLFAVSGNFFFLPFHFTHYIFSMPGLMMIIGLFILINHNDSLLGVIFVGIGGFWFLSRYSDFPVNHLLSEYWPILIILFGIYIIFKKDGSTFNRRDNLESDDYDIDYIDEVTILGGGRKNINSQKFKGGKITAILGSVDIDLHESNLAEGNNSLEITAIFGGIDIVVPKDWQVVVTVTSIFGGFDDKRILNANQVYESNKVLIIRGTVIFGGGELKTY
ncbi:MAG: cell wall-active antibiotics response protein [Melioribacteraceae bacterium]|nr:cell wall-active antibiotics response protein [Melioribacteraceae bacterium]